MKSKKQVLQFLFLFLFVNIGFPLTAFAQLELRPLMSNPIIEAAYLRQNLQKKKWAADSKPIVRQLPFIDDFSGLNNYPNDSLWQGNTVFINNTFPFYPPTLGVATFDAFDERGWIYSQASILGNSFESDTLTSQIIRLDSIFAPYPKALSAADSIYLSFYYQPGGGGGNLWDPSRRGFTPQAKDALTLEFYNQALDLWVRVWEAEGQSLDSFCNHFADTNLPIQNKFYFRQVMIPIVREAFLQSSFQFRFRAKSSIDPHFRSGGGQWHIDYVYVNTGRSLADTVLRDIAIVETQPSLLKAYQKVPFKQFKPNMLKDTRSLLISNLYNTALSCKYQYTIANEQGDQIYAQPNSGEANSNLFPFITSGYTSDPDISKFPMSYPFDEVNAKEQNFTIRHIVKVDLQNDLIPQNDTLSFTQDFGNEFAYDDGTSEAGIGLTYPSFMAYKFTLNVADTLTAIRICFNHSYENNNEIGFKICVWNADSNGLPKNILYKSPITLPQITLPLNSFGKYILNTPLILEPGNFFVGIEQLSSDYLNFGYDQNRNACEQLFYYYMNDQNVWAWKNSIYYGSWMLRPAFGMGATIENDNISTVDRQSKQLIIYPNPLRNTSLNLRLPPTCDAQHSRVRIFDLSGRMLIDCNYQTQINLPSTKAGLYTVQLWDRKSGLSYYAKLIIVR